MNKTSTTRCDCTECETAKGEQEVKFITTMMAADAMLDLNQQDPEKVFEELLSFEELNARQSAAEFKEESFDIALEYIQEEKSQIEMISEPLPIIANAPSFDHFAPLFDLRPEITPLLVGSNVTLAPQKDFSPEPFHIMKNLSSFNYPNPFFDALAEIKPISPVNQTISPQEEFRSEPFPIMGNQPQFNYRNTVFGDLAETRPISPMNLTLIPQEFSPPQETNPTVEPLLSFEHLSPLFHQHSTNLAYDPLLPGIDLSLTRYHLRQIAGKGGINIRLIDGAKISRFDHSHLNRLQRRLGFQITFIQVRDMLAIEVVHAVDTKKKIFVNGVKLTESDRRNRFTEGTIIGFGNQKWSTTYQTYLFETEFVFERLW